MDNKPLILEDLLIACLKNPLGLTGTELTAFLTRLTNVDHDAAVRVMLKAVA